jgi:hypothetical protein
MYIYIGAVPHLFFGQAYKESRRKSSFRDADALVPVSGGLRENAQP